MEALIELRNVGLAFERDGRRTPVLSGLDLDVTAGEFVAIVGSSGVGKSTLLRLLMDLVQPNEGTVTVRAKPHPGRLPLALVFQDARLLPWRRVASNVGFGLEHGGISAVEHKRRVADALALVGLADYGERYPHELSGGQRQRVALARALAVDPDVLLMDEPFASVDAITRESLQDELLRVHAATGKTILFVTHDIDEAVLLADRVVPLAGQPAAAGRIAQVSIPRPRRRGDPALTEVAAMVRRELAASTGPQTFLP
jgi:NitT/TauT family transport system ATP-binding protein